MTEQNKPCKGCKNGIREGCYNGCGKLNKCEHNEDCFYLKAELDGSTSKVCSKCEMEKYPVSSISKNIGQEHIDNLGEWLTNETSPLGQKLSTIETKGQAMIEAKKEIEIAKYEAERSGLRVRPAETKYLLAKEEFTNL